MQSVSSQVRGGRQGDPSRTRGRGIVAIAFGVLILSVPNISLSLLVLLVGAFAAVDGVVSLVVAWAPIPTGTRVLYILNGIAGLIVAAITVVSPGITELALVYLVGFWAIAIGVIQFSVAFGAPIDARYRVFSFIYGVISRSVRRDHVTPGPEPEPWPSSP